VLSAISFYIFISNAHQVHCKQPYPISFN